MTSALLRARRPALMATAATLLALLAISTAPLTATAAGARPAAAGARSTLLVDDYPYKGTPLTPITTDIWRFSASYCTSFVAWRINDLLGKRDWANHNRLNTSDESYWAFKNFMPKPGGGTVQLGDGMNWAAAAAQLGWTVDNKPTVGSIGQWGPGDSPTTNHVAVVSKLNSDGTVVFEEYNWTNPGAYDQRTGMAPRYIHVPGVPTVAAADVQVPPFSTSSAYVTQTYKDVLNRPPTSTELSTWAGKINSGTDPGQLVTALLGAPPFSTASSPTVRLYLAYFKRAPDLGGYDYWVGRLIAGTANPYWVSDAFADSPEFKATYGSLDNPSFVDLVYQNVLGRAADPAGRAYWIDQLNKGMSRGAVMTNFSESPENVQATLPKVDTARVYLAILQRSPDPDGWGYWTGQMAQGKTTIALLADNFRHTSEYINRVAASTS